MFGLKVALLYLFYTSKNEALKVGFHQPISYRQLLSGLENSAFDKIYFSPDLKSVTAITKDLDQQYDTTISPLLTEKLVDVSVKNDVEPVFLNYQPNVFSFLPSLIFPLILFSIFRTFLYGMQSGGQSNQDFNMFGIGKSQFKINTETNVTFSDWAGSKEVLEECTEFVEYLKNSTYYQKIGAKLPRGILLEGPPGTGKTLLAKAIATESNSSFITASGSEFVEMFVGVGAQRIRKLFEEARKMAPCIIFIDEIDAIGKQRGKNVIMGNDEREQTLNQLLTEMDGFNNNENITIMAATNRMDILDSALLRPGRFDRIINIPLPDLNSRREILQLYLKDKIVDSTVNYDTLAKMTSGYSGAEIKNLINEASIIAARNQKLIITETFLEEAVEKSMIGIKKRIDNRDDNTKRRVAIHEVGHAFVCNLFEEYFDLQKVSIQPSYSGVGGFTLFTEKFNISESRLYTKDFLIKRLMVALGGKAAESVYYGDDFVSLGASMDLVQANGLATEMIEKYGMGNKLIVFSKNDEYGKSYSEVTKTLIDKEVAELVNEAYKSVRELIVQNKPIIDKYVNELLDNVVISADKFRNIV
jgi:cell division protease FtsH